MSNDITAALLPCPCCDKSDLDLWPCEWLDSSGENCHLWDRSHYECALREIERLRAENEALRTNAARYRELRQGDLDDIAIVHGIGTSDSGISGVVYTYQIELTGDELDKAIDVRSKESLHAQE